MRSIVTLVVLVTALVANVACNKSAPGGPTPTPTANAGNLTVTLNGSGQRVNGLMVNLTGAMQAQGQADQAGKTTFTNVPFGAYAIALADSFGFELTNQAVQIVQSEQQATLSLVPKDEMQIVSQTPACGSSVRFDVPGVPFEQSVISTKIRYNLTKAISPGATLKVVVEMSVDGVSILGSGGAGSTTSSNALSGVATGHVSIAPGHGSETNFHVRRIEATRGGKVEEVFLAEMVPCHYTFHD